MLGSTAKNLAHGLLADELPPRWKHVQAVSRRAQGFEHVHAPRTVELLVAAGFVHDIGYSKLVKDTGFHPIDGARYLRNVGFDEDIVCLVAHHTCAHIEAGLRDLRSTLFDEFRFDPTLPHDELLYCDLTTGPDGELVTVPDRLREVKERYGPDDLVHRFIVLAEGDLLAAAQRAEARLLGRLAA